jgi:hypothetical protein
MGLGFEWARTFRTVPSPNLVHPKDVDVLDVQDQSIPLVGKRPLKGDRGEYSHEDLPAIVDAEDLTNMSDSVFHELPRVL